MALGTLCELARPLFVSELGWFLGAGAGFTAAYFALTLALGEARLPARVNRMLKLA